MEFGVNDRDEMVLAVLISRNGQIQRSWRMWKLQTCKVQLFGHRKTGEAEIASRVGSADSGVLYLG